MQLMLVVIALAQLVEDRRPDIRIIDDRTRLDENLGDVSDVIDAYLPSRPVYVIRIEPPEIAALERRYALAYLEGFDATGLTQVLAQGVQGTPLAITFEREANVPTGRITAGRKL